MTNTNKNHPVIHPSARSPEKNGYTLYIILVILSITGILVTISIANLRAARVAAKLEVQRSQARLLAESGIVRTEYFFNGGDGHSVEWETPQYTENVGEFGNINLSVSRLGLFSRVQSTGSRMVTSQTVSCLFGRTVPRSLQPSLTLTGHVGGLIIHKGSSVDGRIVLHHGFVYAKKKGMALPEYTARLTFKESPPLPFDTLLLPKLFERYEEHREEILRSSRNGTGTLVLDGSNDSLFARKPLVVDGDCRILTGRCENAEIIVAGTCTIQRGAVIRSTACYAKKINCEDGVTGKSMFFSEEAAYITAGIHNSQFLSNDSVIAGKKAAFGTMSLFASVRRETGKDSLSHIGGGIYFDDNMTFCGSVICCNASAVSRSAMSPSIVFGKNSAIRGTVVTDGDCSLHTCDIKGHLWARSIVASDDGMEYTNYLVGTTIRHDIEELPFPLLGELPVEMMRME